MSLTYTRNLINSKGFSRAFRALAGPGPGAYKAARMRHPGIRACGLLLAAALLCAAGPAHAAAPAVERARMGVHDAFHRLVIDLTGAPADFSAVAAGPRTFVITLPGVRLGPGGAEGLRRADVAGYALTAGRADGALRLRLDAPAPAHIRRAFVMAPARAGGPWRLVVDLGSAAAGRQAPAQASVEARATRLDLPAMHGIAPGEARAATAPERPPATEVSWARASRILRELQAHAAPGADRAPPPQLELPERYRNTTVPLR